MISISFEKFSDQHCEKSALALFCDGANFIHDEYYQQLNNLLQGRLEKAVSMQEFNGVTGQSLQLIAPTDSIAQLHLIGCGAKDKSTVSDIIRLQHAGSDAFQALRETKIKNAKAYFIIPQTLAEQSAPIALGARLKAYNFSLYQSDKKEIYPQEISILLPQNASLTQIEAQWAEFEALSEGVYLARNLVSEPANVLYPESFRARIEALEPLGLEIDVLDRAAMASLGFGALLGVAQGSNKPPYTVIIRYQGATDKDEAPLAFIGKGVTFDSGGISIKPAAGMEDMKTDMGGAAAVVGLMSVLARRKAKINAIGVVGLVENMVSGDAQRPGDVVKSYSGQTIEVQNTDAEGRLVLADLLSYTKDKYAPSLMVNLATLTGAIVVALGTDYAGLFSNDSTLSTELKQAGEKAGEKLWPMPMGESYNRRIDSDIADMKNIGGRPGSSILAAEFLKRFVGDTSWAHLDIAGTAWCDKAGPCIPKGASGFGVQLLNQFVADREH
ncbi:leucyl aminopeptidase [Aristophania vespae]|uniref:leucyl aminopeptidase n=1 Tax=Aristophania vespae TaxID=2697033 RepID=UPI002351A5F7|nr:leucyl aminopeptidase [Aristophania vespae]UMM63552.1 Cytosol aminopeptidase [Aristophania vespae]